MEKYLTKPENILVNILMPKINAYLIYINILFYTYKINIIIKLKYLGLNIIILNT